MKSTGISLDIAIDNLHYTYTRNCAPLKEDHLTQASGHDVKDLRFVFGRNSKEDANGVNVDELTTLCASNLRRKHDTMGLDVDGSREAMIQSIKSNS